MDKREAFKANTAAVSLPSHERKVPISFCLMVVALLASLLVWPPDELSSVALAQEEGRQTEPTIPSDAVNLHHNCSDDGTERATGYITSFGIDYGITERTVLDVYSTREADDCNSYSDGDIVIRAEAEIICWYRVTWVIFMPPDCNPPSYTLRSYIVGPHGDASADVDEYDIGSYIYSMREGRISGLRDRFASCEYDPSSSTISIIDTSYSVTSACIIGGNEYYLGPIFQISPPKFRKSRITSKTNNLSPGKWWVKLCHGDEYPNYSDHCSDVEEATRTINFEAIKVVDNIYIRWHGVTSNPAGRAGFPNTVYLRDRHGITALSCQTARATPGARYLNFICTGHTNKLDSDFIVIGPSSNYAARGGTISEREIPKIRVVKMEVTQGLQDWNNNVSLVRGKRTAVRVFLETTTDTQREFFGYLKGTKIDGTSRQYFDTILPVNTGSSVITEQNVVTRRQNINSSLNFILPPNWVDLETNEELELEFTYLQPIQSVLCREDTENRCIETVSFVNVSPPRMEMVPITLIDNPEDEEGTTTDISLMYEGMARIASIMPFPSQNSSADQQYIDIFDGELDAIMRTTFDYNPYDERDDNDIDDIDLSKVNDKLIVARDEAGDEFASSIFLGLLPGPSLYNVTGYALKGDGVASWYVASNNEYNYGYFRNTGPHELAHVFDRPHSVRQEPISDNGNRMGACGSLAAHDAEIYPYFYNFNIERLRPVLGPLPHASNNFDFNDEIWGLDIRYVNPEANENFVEGNVEGMRTRISPEEHADLSVVNPYEVFALMSYCGAFVDSSQGRWIDVHNYNAILQQYLESDDTAEVSGTSGNITKVLSDYFSGTIKLSDDGSPEDINVKPVHSRVRYPASSSTGDYNLELRSSDGTILRSVPFNISEFVLDINPRSNSAIFDETRAANFSLIVSNPPDYSKFAITYEGKDLIEINRSLNAPILRVNGPVDGQRFTQDDSITLSWSASDSDADKLDFRVYYSTDGGSSYDLISQTSDGTSETFKNLDGSEQARLAVSTSDGTRATFVETPVFAVDNHAPIVAIVSPASSSVLAESQGFLLDGWAYDKEDGFLRSSSFSWSSSIGGLLGTGSYLVMSAADLTAGDHRVTLTVTDSGGLTSTATTDFTISRTNQLPIANDDTARIVLDETALLDVLANDTDIEGDIKDELMQIYDLPLLGTAEIINNQRSRAVIAYTAGSVGTDYFTYLICDGIDRCDIAEVTINITTDGCTILGTEQDDTLRGTSGNDVICGLGGDDTIYGSGGNDIIRAGLGDDTIYGQAGNDTIYGGFGNDNILGHRGDDTIYGGFGDEEIWGGGGDDIIWGGYGADEIRGEADNDTLYGEDGPDLIHGGRGDDTIYGGTGDDTIRGNQGADTIYPGPGNNTLLGTAAEDTIIRNFYGR